MPKKKETKPRIYKVNKYIMEQKIKVSSLNIEYTGNTYIKDKVKYFDDGTVDTHNKDKMIKQRWEELRSAIVVKDFDNFKKKLFDSVREEDSGI